MILLGHQIRQSRRKLGWARSELARRAGLPTSVIERAETTDGEAVITMLQMAALKTDFLKAGIKIDSETDGEAP